jgi:hypothetical protein
MIESARYAEIVETPSFERAAKKLFDEDQLSEPSRARLLGVRV